MKIHMENKQEKSGIKNLLKNTGKIIFHWIFLILLLGATAYSFFIWNKYIINVEWSEERKSRYIEEQSVFSFDRKSFQDVLDLVGDREQNLKSWGQSITRDIFFPEEFQEKSPPL